MKKLSKNRRLIIFAQQIDLNLFEQLVKKYQATAIQKRQALQQSVNLLNHNSVSSLKRLLAKFYRQKVIKNLNSIAINNALEVHINAQYLKWFDQFVIAADHLNITPKNSTTASATLLQNHEQRRNKTSSSKASLVLAIIDSGVSTKHQDLQHITNIKQFNPKDGSYHLHDSALGHGTGVFSLLAQKNTFAEEHNQQIEFLSCNGLPQGKYNFLTVLKCLNWLFLQPQVDMILNPWLVDKAGCNLELAAALNMTWAANSFVVFPSGNYGPEQSFSPANYRLYDGSPILSIGSIDQAGKLNQNSSFATSSCDNNFSAPRFVEAADALKVAVPFTESSYQQVSGTSYAIALFARKLASLIMENPNVSNKDMYDALVRSGQNQQAKEAYGYGVLDLQKAQQQLSEKIHGNQ
ncbi:S8/S53 family peptidase [Kangiella sp. TOML190]|uniref:S8/S53 family peptidase n=1 Tax=Kangiella sp. TOML190 TaxID=2931351 RepID=UPI00203FD7AB|nr:S8/S53 family peptidase [Kangiella sp. TOML190]